MMCKWTVFSNFRYREKRTRYMVICISFLNCKKQNYKISNWSRILYKKRMSESQMQLKKTYPSFCKDIFKCFLYFNIVTFEAKNKSYQVEILKQVKLNWLLLLLTFKQLLLFFIHASCYLTLYAHKKFIQPRATHDFFHIFLSIPPIWLNFIKVESVFM